MSDYKRLYLPGGTYFFTLVTHHRRPFLAAPEVVGQLRKAARYVQGRRPFELLAAVILPDHLHWLWTLPPDDADYSVRIQMLKTAFSRAMPAPVRGSGYKTVWQPRFWEHCIRDEADFHRHLDYLHYNPVKHGLVNSPAAWPYGSFARYAAKGWYAEHWGMTEPPSIHQMDCE